MAEIDRLEVAVEAQASKANSELDKLTGKLNKVADSLDKINASGLQGLANGIQRLSTSMQSMNNVKTTDFSRLAKNIQKLGTINQSAINGTASALRQISIALNSTGNMSSGASQISSLAVGLSKLGYKSVSNAITNIPLLANALSGHITTLSKAPRVSNNVISLTNAIANLAAQGGKVRTATNGINSTLNKYASSSQKAESRTRSFASSLATLYAKFYAIKRAFEFIGNSIKKSMDFGETINLFQTSFKKIGMEAAQDSGLEWGSAAADKFAIGFIDKAQAFNDKLVNALNLDPNTTMNYQAVFAQMANAFGLVNDSVMDISESFTMLGLDISSLFNTSVDEAMTKLKAGLAGETEPLRALGIDITEATLKMTALNYGITDSVSKMSMAAKTQLRWLAIMNQSEVAFGDMAKSINSPANQLRILQQQWNNLSRSIGNLFMPIVTTVLPYINALVIALRRLIDTLAKAVGFELPDYKDTNIYTDVTGGISDGNDAIADSANKAADAQKKLQKTTQSFDQLHILNEPSSSSSSSAAGTTGDGSGYSQLDDAINAKTASYMAKFNEELSKMGDGAEKMADKITGFFSDVAKAAEPTLKSLQRLFNEGLSKLGSFTFGTLSSFYKDFLVPIGKWTFGKGIPTLVDTLNDLLKKINWKKLQKAFSDLFKALAPFAINVGDGIINFIQKLGKLLSPVIAKTTDLIADALSLLADAINSISPQTAKDVGQSLGILFTSLALAKGLGGVAGVLTAIGGGLSGLAGGLSMFATLNPMAFVAIFNGIFEDLETWVSTNIEKKFGDIWNKILVIFANVGLGAATGFSVGGIPGAIIGAIGGGLLAAVHEFGWDKIWDTVKTELKNAADTIFNFNATKQTFSNMIDNFKKALSGEDIGKNIISGLYNGIKSALGLVIEPINDLFWGIVNSVKKTLGIHSPSTVFAEIGGYIVDGLKKGITDKWNNFISFISGLPENIVKEFGDISTGFVTKGKNIIDGIQKGWNDNISSFTTWIKGKPASILSSFGNIKDGFLSKGKDIIEGIKGGWNNNLKSFTEWLSAKPQSIQTSFGNIKEKFFTKGSDIISGIQVGWNQSWNNFKTWLSGLPDKIASGIGSLKEAGVNLIKSFISGLKSISIPKLKVDIGTSKKSVLGQEISVPKLNVSWYAKGGLPNTGEMFVAREKGPELVGKMGNNSNTVANNLQIEAGIEEAAYRGYMRAIIDSGNVSGGSSDSSIVVESNLYVDSEKMYSISQKGKAKSERRFQTTLQPT